MTTPSSDRVIEVRRARPEDYEAVLDINKNVYQGTDYLPNGYHTLIADPDFHYYVCLVDGEVGGFEGVCLLDEDKTLLLRSLRIKEKFQGQGLSTHIMAKIFKDFPKDKRLRQSCSEESRFVRSKTFRSQMELLKMERRVRFREIDVKQMDPVTTNHEEAKPISWEDFRHLIEINPVKTFLFPDNIMTQDFWFYDVIPGNVRHLEKRCPRVFITKQLYRFLPGCDNSNCDSSSKNYGDSGHDNDCEKGGNCNGMNVTEGVLGIVSSYFSPTYLYMVINLSGEPTKGKTKEEMTSLLQHAIAYAQSLHSEDLEKRKLVFAIVCNQELPEDLFLEIAKPFGFQPAKPEDNFREQYYFQRRGHT